MQVSQRRTDFTGPALIRLLARLTEVEVPESPQAFADRLSQWLGWTDAIALSTALNGGPSTATAPSADARVSPAQAAEGECARVRASLAKAIAEDSVFAPLPVRTPTGKAGAPPMPPQAPAADAAGSKPDFAPYRLRYQARQQGMDAAIGPLREKLRARLAAHPSAALARLAAIDAVMEQALGEQERRLLAGLPALLEKYFERLRRQHEAEQAQNPDSPDNSTTAAPWLPRFGKDVQSVLLAELELRYQPVEGLLQALRT